MKWIGQLIYDQIARFRDDIYLEGISTSTETDILVVDSSNKISKRAASGLTSGTATLASTVTVTDSTTATAFPVVFHDESNALLDDTGAFTYNPSTGTLVTPNLTVSGTTTTINTTNLNVEDKNITLNYNDSSDTSGTADGAGITIQDAVDASNDASLTWTAADDTFEFSHAVEINNGASGGTAALTIDNDDVDQMALDINADNTSANIIDIDARALTHGNAIIIDSHSIAGGSLINLDVEDIYTLAPILNHNTNPTKLINIDYDKSGVTQDSGSRYVNALDISMVDAATNHANSTNQFIGVNIAIDAASNQGSIKQAGVKVTLTDADTSLYDSVGFWSITEDGGHDFLAQSSANEDDYFSILTTVNGSTVLKTVDDDAALAHFEVEADGNITLDAVGDIALEAAGNDVTVDTDNLNITSSTSDFPLLTLEATHTDKFKSGRLKFVKNAADIEVGEYLGEIDFFGDNDADEEILYSSIISTPGSVTDGSETGSFFINVRNGSGVMTSILQGVKNASDADQVDVSIAAGSASTTTVAGTLTMGSTATLNNTGEIQVASQPNITTLAGLTNFGSAGAATQISAGDLRMFNAVNDGNPSISLGSSVTNRLEIQAIYNSGTQTLDEVAFQSYTTDGGTSDGRFKFYIDEVLTFKMADTSVIVYGDLYSDNSNGFIRSNNQAASSTTGGGKLILQADDGAAMADDHRLGVIEFKGAEDASNTRSIGARIDAVCRDAWDGSNNDADLEFYTTNGTTESKVLTLNADGNVVTTGNIELGHDTDTTIARSAAGKVTIEGNQVVTAGAVNVSSGSQSPIGMQVARRTITTGEANTMFTGGFSYAPIELIPAQGANTIIMPTSCMAKVDRAANQTNGSTTMDVHYDGQTGGYGASSLFHWRRFGFGETTDYVERRSINQVTSGLTLTEDVNKAVEISFNGGAPTTDCFTSIDIFITYYVLDIS